MKKTRKIFSLLLALVLCFSLTTTTFAKETTLSTFETQAATPRAGGGSTAKFVTGELNFTFPVYGSGMRTIRVVVSGTTDNNITVGTVTAPNGTEFSFNIIGNNTDSKWHLFSLPAGTYSVYVATSVASSVVEVYVE